MYTFCTVVLPLIPPQFAAVFGAGLDHMWPSFQAQIIQDPRMLNGQQTYIPSQPSPGAQGPAIGTGYTKNTSRPTAHNTLRETCTFGAKA